MRHLSEANYARYTSVLLSLFITFGMSLVMSFAMTVFNSGIGVGFIDRWLSAWVISFAVALPAAAVIIPVSKKIVARILGSNNE